MNIKGVEFVIDETDPFKNCKLDRKKYADPLTALIGYYKEGFVLAINNKWGTGKTTFLRMWQKHLEKKEFTTLYFNAWENDFESDPLISLISELKVLQQPDTKRVFNSLVSKAALIAKKALPDLFKAIAARYVDADALKDVVKNVADAGTEIFETEVNEYVKKKQALGDFRKKLQEFIEKSKSRKPIVFIIDELDRCRPNYAVELLEKVKHLFSVKGISFVLSIDKIQLGHSIQGVYNSEKIDAENYLKRFIDLEYNLPEPNVEVFCNYLFEYYEFDTFFFSENRKKSQAFAGDKKFLLSISSLFFGHTDATLRQQEKVFAHMRLGLLMMNTRDYIFPNLYFTLFIFKHFKPDIYFKIKSKVLTHQQLMDELFSLYAFGKSTVNHNALIKLEAMLLVFYNTYLEENKIEIVALEGNKMKPVVKSHFDSTLEQGTFLGAIDDVRHGNDYSSVSLEYLLVKIDMLELIVL